jgi:hypothetical protein
MMLHGSRTWLTFLVGQEHHDRITPTMSLIQMLIRVLIGRTDPKLASLANSVRLSMVGHLDSKAGINYMASFLAT